MDAGGNDEANSAARTSRQERHLPTLPHLRAIIFKIPTCFSSGCQPPRPASEPFGRALCYIQVIKWARTNLGQPRLEAKSPKESASALGRNGIHDFTRYTSDIPVEGKRGRITTVADGYIISGVLTDCMQCRDRILLGVVGESFVIYINCHDSLCNHH